MSRAAPEAPASLPAAPDAGRASGSSFYVAMRILPKPRRLAMYAVYDFCRSVDDIADEGGTRDERLAALSEWRRAIHDIYGGRNNARADFLREHVVRYDLQETDFLDMIDGMEMDASADIRAPSLATLDGYCDRVASSVGRLSTRIFGLEREPGKQLAHHLGRGLQLTNILRDIDEDAAIGRLYLPCEYLEAHGIVATEPQVAIADDAALDAVCRRLAADALAHLDRADAIMKACSRKVVRAPRLMWCAYRPVLEGMVQRGWHRPRVRIGVDKVRLLGAVLRHGIL